MVPYFESKTQSIESSIEKNPLLMLVKKGNGDMDKPPMMIEQLDDYSREPSFLNINKTFD